MTHEQRIMAVLNGDLPAEALTDEELLDLQDRVLTAIAKKLGASEQRTELQ